MALMDDDYNLALESLSIVAKQALKDPKYLYACVLEAQQSNMRRVAVVALQTLLQQQPQGVHLPSLLRCTVRLLIGELDSVEQQIDDVFTEVVSLFERAAKNTASLRQGNAAQWQSEIQWWSKNAYNLALRMCGRVNIELLIRLLVACTRLIDYLSHNQDSSQRTKVTNRRMICHFLSASAYIVLARASEEGSDSFRQSYMHARVQIAAYLEQDVQLDHLTTAPKSDSPQGVERSARKFELLSFDLECLLRLELWSAVDAAVQKLLDHNGADRWDSLVDLMVILHNHASAADAPPETLSKVPMLLQKSINEAWKRDKDIHKMARWLRLTFTIYVEDDGFDFALTIVQQAAGVARTGYEGKTAERYPFDELSWLAGTAFNKAVDMLQTEEESRADRWMDAALELARFADDNGSLHANISGKKEAVKQRLAERL